MRLSYMFSLWVFGAIGVLALTACGTSETQGIVPASEAELAAEVATVTSRQPRPESTWERLER